MFLKKYNHHKQYSNWAKFNLKTEIIMFLKIILYKRNIENYNVFENKLWFILNNKKILEQQNNIFHY